MCKLNIEGQHRALAGLTLPAIVLGVGGWRAGAAPSSTLRGSAGELAALKQDASGLWRMEGGTRILLPTCPTLTDSAPPRVNRR